jgi:carbamoyltransferase
MDILGISAFYHDSAACVVRDGDIIAAAQEERFTCKKHDAGFPGHAIRYCLGEAGIAITDLRYIVFYDKPLIRFEPSAGDLPSLRSQRPAILHGCDACVAQGKTPAESAFAKGIDGSLRRGENGNVAPDLFGEHHESHAAAF